MNKIEIQNTKVYNIVDALRGMRNPLNSWYKNDTVCHCDEKDGHVLTVSIGENDKELARRLIRAGTEHRKFLRQIKVSVDLVMPNYMTNEFDTYKIATDRNSCSLQHKGSSRDFVANDFHVDTAYDDMVSSDLYAILHIVNKYRRLFVETKDYKYFRLMRQFMPMSYLYRFTWTANYEVLLNMYRQRKNHRLVEWHDICDWIKSLPGMDVFLIESKEENV